MLFRSKAQKIFDVAPSDYVTEFTEKAITNNYIRNEVQAALELKPRDEEEEMTQEALMQEDTPEERLCPTCKNNLVFVEGCSICIECGFSGCTSG